MNKNLVTAALLLAVAIGATVMPAEARGFGFNGGSNWTNGLHRGWGQGIGGGQGVGWGGGQGSGWRQAMGGGQCGGGMGHMGWGRRGFGLNNQSGYNNGYGNQSGFGGLIGQDSRLFNKQTRIQQELASGNLSPGKAAFLQNELSRIQNRETGLNGLIGNGLTSKESRIQQLLSSGNLSPSRATRLQNELARLQGQQTALGSGTPFANTSLWGRLRNGF